MATKKGTGSRRAKPVKKGTKTTRKPAARRKPAKSSKTAAAKRAAIAAARRKLGPAKYREIAATARSMLKRGEPTHVVAAAVDRQLAGATSGVDALYIVDCLT